LNVKKYGQLLIQGIGGFIYIKGGSINRRNGYMILVVQKFWQSELAIKLKSICKVWKGKESRKYQKGMVGGIII